ncbi:hypothetical protein BC332_04357 [Capsicum chinense]|nr:hypothetical protein BC332_04357 [Capsicum chinense]
MFTASLKQVSGTRQSANGLGLQAASGRDYCDVIMKFPSETVPKWKDPKTGELEGLSYELNLCEAVATWEQVSKCRPSLTATHYVDCRLLLMNRCENRTLCMEKLSLVLPERPALFPRQYGRCAVIGNSGDLLKTKFGDEIDSYEAVFRENGAPIQQQKALEFALSICDTVDMYGFKVDLGYKEWTRYFFRVSARSYTSSRKIILSNDGMPRDRVVKWLPSRSTITAARIASEKLLRRVGAGSNNLLATCSIIKKQQKGNDVDISNLRKAAVEHHKCVKGTTMIPLEHNPGHGQLCTVPNKLMNLPSHLNVSLKVGSSLVDEARARLSVTFISGLFSRVHENGTGRVHENGTVY